MRYRSLRRRYLSRWRIPDRSMRTTAVRMFSPRLDPVLLEWTGCRACLRILERRPRRPVAYDAGPAAKLGARPLPPSDFPWLQPYPDLLLDEGPEPADAGVARETIELARTGPMAQKAQVVNSGHRCLEQRGFERYFKRCGMGAICVTSRQGKDPTTRTRL